MPHRAVRGQHLTTYFQPIVALNDQCVVGYEALSRWPELGLGPLPVLAHARHHNCVDLLDRNCIDNAIIAAGSRLSQGAVLSLNSEPSAAYVGRDHSHLLDHAAEHFQIMFEITERDLLQCPADLLQKIDAMRSDGFAVALDDVGVNPASRAILDVTRPDVVKLDLRLMKRNPTADYGRTLAAVLAYREQSGATILAEGIENEEQLEQALAVGADLGQGYLFGRATATPTATTRAWKVPQIPREANYLSETAVRRSDLIRVVRKDMLVAFSRSIEGHILKAGDKPIVLASMQHRRFFSGRTRQIYLELAATCPLVAVFAEGLSQAPCEGVRVVDVDHRDPLAHVWMVIVIGDQSSAALYARERDEPSTADNDRSFDFRLTQDRQLVGTAARQLMSRIGAQRTR